MKYLVLCAILLAGCAQITTKDGTKLTAWFNGAACSCGPTAATAKLGDVVPQPSPVIPPAKADCLCVVGPVEATQGVVSIFTALTALGVGLAA